MNRLFLIVVAFCGTACSQKSQSEDSRAAMAIQLPAKFTLSCEAPKGSEVPDGAAKGFKVLIDRTTNRFSLSWDSLGPWPIAKIGPNQIVLADDHTDHGIDGNPERRRIIFDLQNGTLNFRHAYSGFVPVNRAFSARCEIMNDA
jgi:hypothetical protein